MLKVNYLYKNCNFYIINKPNYYEINNSNLINKCKNLKSINQTINNDSFFQSEIQYLKNENKLLREQLEITQKLLEKSLQK